MRIFIGFLIAAIALYLRSGCTHPVVIGPGSGNPLILHEKYSWQDPLAIFIAVAGVGAGIAVALPAFRR